MAVAFDAVGPSSSGTATSGATSLSWSHSCSGTDRVVYVGVSVDDSPDTGHTSTATYNGASMTSLAKIHVNNGATGYIELFRLINPPIGASTVVVSSAAGPEMVGGSVSVTGVNQTSPEGSSGSTAGTGTSISIPMSSTTGNLVLTIMGAGQAFSSTTNTSRWQDNFDPASSAGCATQTTEAGASSVSISSTLGLSGKYAGVAIDIQQASVIASAPWISTV